MENFAETFGDYLKSQREKKGIRLEEIASITKIHHHSLELLEAGAWNKLPPEPFIRGFIIAYAKYVGLDAKEAINRYLQETHGKTLTENEAQALSQTHSEEPPRPIGTPPAAAHRTPTEVMEQARPLSPKQILTALGALVAVIVMGTIIYVGKSNWDHGEEPVAEAPKTEMKSEGDVAVAPPPTDATTAPASPQQAFETPLAPATSEPREIASPIQQAALPSATPSATPKPDHNHEVVVIGGDRTWTKVVIDEEPPTEFFLPQGEKATYRAKNKIKVVLGNSNGAKVTHNGEDAPGVKFQGTIRSYIFPAEARFPQDIPKKRAVTAEEPAPAASAVPETTTAPAQAAETSSEENN